MLPAEDRDELRMLQRKAYGRDGALTDAEARRLRELERPAPAPAPAPRPAAAPDEPTLVTAVPDRVRTDTTFADLFPEDSTPDRASEQDPDQDAEPPTPQKRQRAARPRGAWAMPRRYGLAVAAASVLLLAVGVGVGWGLFGQDPNAITLTEEQQQRRLELYEKGPYDEGSIRPIGQEGDALVWYGTQNDGVDACLVLDVADQSGRQCQPRAEVMSFSLAASVMAMTTATEESDTVEAVNVNAFLLFATNGEPLVSIQRWTQSVGQLNQFSGEERERAEELLEDDETASLQIVGSFRDEPVWLIDRLLDDGVERCLVVDAVEEHSQCARSEDAIDSGISTLVFVDDGAGGSEAWSLQVAYTVNQMPYLVVARELDPANLTSGETYQEYGDRTELGGEYGDSVEVSSGTAPGD